MAWLVKMKSKKVNKMQLFGFMLEAQKKINDVFREKTLFPESKGKYLPISRRRTCHIFKVSNQA